jgi:CRISPR-associated protein Cas2
MRILVMLNPTNRHGTKMAYTELRKFLINDGYLKLQPDVFMVVEDTKKIVQNTKIEYNFIYHLREK